ncbi:hypothetical protein B0H14DRAFT_2656080 [Mycena olivaceomarginata]|nr:hypothetical protein B0H14DRAFT_2656080 [Mycena olivaceomarginata]
MPEITWQYAQPQSYERDMNPEFVGQASMTYKQIGSYDLLRDNPSQPVLFIDVSEAVVLFGDFLAKAGEKMLPADRRRSQSAASERYRERNREAVLQAGRERSARRRAALKSLKPGDETAKRMRERAREASARYRANHRELLAAKQRTVRKKAYIKKYGYLSFVRVASTEWLAVEAWSMLLPSPFLDLGIHVKK